jgi:hypothetical protein
LEEPGLAVSVHCLSPNLRIGACDHFRYYFLSLVVRSFVGLDSVSMVRADPAAPVKVSQVLNSAFRCPNSDHAIVELHLALDKVVLVVWVQI